MIVIPTYNERGNIRTLTAKIRATLPDMDIVFVDDSSPDQTSEEINQLKVADPKIHLIKRPQKSGFASAHLDGIKYALKSGALQVFTMDADLSHDPSKLAQMIEKLKENDLVIGSRYVPGGNTVNWSVWRKILSRFANFYGRCLTGMEINDVTSGMIGYNSSLLNRLDLDSIKSQGYAYLMEIKNLCWKLNPKISEVPISFIERTQGQSKISNEIIWEGISFPIKILLQRYRQLEPKLLLGTILFILTLGIYSATLPHTIFLGDSPEFITVGSTLGIPHPSGYSAYVILAYLFTFLPFGTLAFKVSFFSAISASIGLVFFYLLLAGIAKKLKPNLSLLTIYGVSFSAALILAFSEIFWSQAIMAKAYMSAFALIMCVMYLLFRYLEIPKNGYLYASLFLAGFGSGLHMMVLLILPINILWVYLYKNGKIWGNFFRQKISYKFAVISLGLFFFGALVNLYLPIRSAMNPGYDFSQIFNMTHPSAGAKAFWDYLSRQSYADTAKSFHYQDKLNFTSGFLSDVHSQFGWLWVLALAGLLALLLRHWIYFTLTFFVIFGNTLLVILIRSSGWGVENDFYYSFYFIPAYSILAFWAGLGIVEIYDYLKQYGEKIIMSVLICLVIASPIWLLNKNWQKNDLSEFTFLEDYSRKTLESLPPNSILLTPVNAMVDDSLIFSFYYQQVVNNLRPDVTILTQYDIHREVPSSVINFVYGVENPRNARYYLTKLTQKAKEYENRPIYSTYLVDNLKLDKPSFSCSNGLVYAVQLGSTAKCDLGLVDIDDEKDRYILQLNFFGQDLWAQYKYAKAANLLEHGKFSESQNEFIDAINYDVQVNDINSTSYKYHRNKILNKIP